MKRILTACLLATILLPLTAVPSKADWDHGHGHGGYYGYRNHYYGGGYYYGSVIAPYSYYPYGVGTYAYPAPPVIPYAVAPVAEAPPPTIVGSPSSIAYYCSDPSGYYPYVSTCFRHWHAIPVQ